MKAKKFSGNWKYLLANQQLTFIRDKKSCYQGLITDFMKKIGVGKAVVIVTSDKYLKSPYCMFELMKIYRNHNLTDQIFPIVPDDAIIFDPVSRLEYLRYWLEKKAILEDAIESSVQKTL